MDIGEDELFAAFGQKINGLILRHRRDLERKRQSKRPAGITGRWVRGRNAHCEPKARWVDGTPEYSLFICGLRKLFPQARFVHIFREVGEVVRSMLNFHRIAGTHLVANEEEAYKYWFRTVKACVKAEEAYGPTVVHRIRYADLIKDPQAAMRSVLDFLAEPYCAQCLEPLSERINSSNVPLDFTIGDPTVNPSVLEKAMRLCRQVNETSSPARTSSVAAAAMETAFRQRVKYVASVDIAYKKMRELVKTLNPSALVLCAMTHAALAIGASAAVTLSQLS